MAPLAGIGLARQGQSLQELVYKH